MPITVACACGKSFKAKEQLAGRTAKCPACGGKLKIPDAARQSDDTSPRQATSRGESTVTAKCQCGKQFKAKRSLAGRTVKCPACGGVLKIPHVKKPAAAATLPADDAPQSPLDALFDTVATMETDVDLGDEAAPSFQPATGVSANSIMATGLSAPQSATPKRKGSKRGMIVGLIAVAMDSEVWSIYLPARRC